MTLPRLYTDLAHWWPLVSPPETFAQEGEFVFQALRHGLGRKVETVLELGSGGGNTAHHLRPNVGKLTLLDASPAMLEVSRKLNPECEHVEGDMRTARLDRKFDAVLIHDAIMCMSTEDDLRAALATAREHVRDDGVVLVMPDCEAESFRPNVQMGGRDDPGGSGHALRYLEWQHEPAEGACAFDVDFAFMLATPDGATEVVHDRHRRGVFTRAQWKAAFVAAKFAILHFVRHDWRGTVFLARPGTFVDATDPSST